MREEDEAPTRRVEIIHESLLANWPRLVRWQTQDADAAQLRDQLRQAARTWDEHDRTDDMLWTGAAYREFAVWRERYPGGLSDLEEAYSTAMTSLATRRKRRRRIAVTTGFAALLAILAVVGTLWRRSTAETRRAEAETAQREAAQLLALGRLKLADHPNAALAYAIASLERADNGPARRFAVEALWQGPPALFLGGPNPWSAAWSPDGRWLALGGSEGVDLLERGSHGARRLSSSLERTTGFTPDSRRLVTELDSAPTTYHVWALPEGLLERTVTLPERTGGVMVGDRFLALTFDSPEPLRQRSIPARLLFLDGTTQRQLGIWRPRGQVRVAVDPTGTWLFSIQEGRAHQQRLDDLAAPGRVLGALDGAARIVARPWRDRAVTGDSSGKVHIWNVPAARLERTLESPAPATVIALDPQERFVATGPSLLDQCLPPWLFLFDLAAPRAAEPAPLLGGVDVLLQMQFSPDGSWLTTVHNGTVILWSMVGERSIVLDRQKTGYGALAFTPNGELLATSLDGVLRQWSLSPAADDGPRQLWSRPDALVESWLEVDPEGRSVVLTERFAGNFFVIPLDGSQVSTHELERPPGAELWSVPCDLDPSGRFVASTVSCPQLSRCERAPNPRPCDRRGTPS